MKIPVYDQSAKEVANVSLPTQFQEEIRDDLVKKAVQALQANARQRYGAKPGAGMRQSAKISRQRHDYKTAYGIGISRAPRKTMTRRGTRFFWVGAVAPGTVGGRRSHPPKAEKIWKKNMNINERRKAIRGALAATVLREMVAKRGHQVPEHYPLALTTDVEKLSKTQDVIALFLKLGLKTELARISIKKIRPGIGKTRGRPYRKKKGPLIVVADECPLLHAARNIQGVDAVPVQQLNAALLAPGADLGRLTLFTQAALEKLEQQKLFM